jgi:hypothetical protein
VKWRSNRFAAWTATRGFPINRSDRELLALRDCHKGRRAFIIGNGPSLEISDLDRLRDEVTFGSNKIYLAFEKTEWRPTYYSVIDIMLARQQQAIVASLPVKKIFPSEVRHYYPESKDIVWVRTRGQSETGNFVFSKNLLQEARSGWTITYFQAQLAYFMGIRELYYIGLDFNFTIPKVVVEESERGPVLVSSGEKNHFDPRYHEPGEKVTVPRLDMQYKSYESTRDAFATDGGAVYNASRKTALDVFPLVNFDEIPFPAAKSI